MILSLQFLLLVEIEPNHPAIYVLAAPATAAMSTTATMKATAATAEAGPAAGFKPPRIPAARNSTKRAWMTASTAVKRLTASRSAAVKRLTPSCSAAITPQAAVAARKTPVAAIISVKVGVAIIESVTMESVGMAAPNQS